MNALDIMASLCSSIIESEKNPQDIRKSAFALVCASESFEQYVEERFRSVASALRISAVRLYEALTIEAEPFRNNEVAHPLQTNLAFKRFERIFFCLNDVSSDFATNDWRAQICWRNVQDVYRSVRYVMVRNSRLNAAS